jgi:hypothetical protein
MIFIVFFGSYFIFLSAFHDELNGSLFSYDEVSVQNNEIE